MEDSSIYESGGAVGSSGDEAAMAVMFGVLGFVVILSYIINAIFMGMMFKKAGEPAWKAWVPVYNFWTFLELGGQKGWISLLVLLSWIPVLGFIPAIVFTVFVCIAAYRIGLNFGKEGWFVVLYIFVTIVWQIWLAVDKTAVWNSAAPGVDGNNTTPPAAPNNSATPQQPTAM